jgi:dTDP-4-amino-4,6-dideoxygalactose transaminase
MKKEIGSDFNIGLELFFKRKKKNIPKKSFLLSSGRDCIYFILDSLKLNNNHKILLPSYLCHTILCPIKEKKLNYSFYKINKNLEVDLNDLRKKIKKEKPNIILIINYFGFIQPNLSKIKEICQKKEIKLVEDNVQSFLSPHQTMGDFVFNSYRKFIPTPDGAFLLGKFPKKVKINNSPKKFTSKRFTGGILKTLKIFKNYYRNLFSSSEKKDIDNYKKPARMSKISKYLLNRINLEKISIKRRRNYSFLSKNLNNSEIIPLYTNLDPQTTPLGFPIICKSEKEKIKIKENLIRNKIYPPIHWPLPEEVSKNEFKESWNISKCIMTLPIDQRYTPEDMKKILKILNK